MKAKYLRVINEMRTDGYLIIIWTPEELKSVDASHMEDVLIERGNDILEMLQGENK